MQRTLTGSLFLRTCPCPAAAFKLMTFEVAWCLRAACDQSARGCEHSCRAFYRFSRVGECMQQQGGKMSDE